MWWMACAHTAIARAVGLRNSALPRAARHPMPAGRPQEDSRALRRRSDASKSSGSSHSDALLFNAARPYLPLLKAPQRLPQGL